MDQCDLFVEQIGVVAGILSHIQKLFEQVRMLAGRSQFNNEIQVKALLRQVVPLEKGFVGLFSGSDEVPDQNGSIGRGPNPRGLLDPLIDQVPDGGVMTRNDDVVFQELNIPQKASIGIVFAHGLELGHYRLSKLVRFDLGGVDLKTF